MPQDTRSVRHEAAPVLATPRLSLRLLRAGDEAAFAAMLADPIVCAPKGFPEGASPEQALGGLMNALGHWAVRGFGLFAVEERATGAFVGCVGIIQPPGWPGPEASWTIARSFQGRGYATEAARVVIEHASLTWGMRRLVSFIAPDNVASIRVVEKLGARREGSARVVGDPVEVFVLLG